MMEMFAEPGSRLKLLDRQRQWFKRRLDLSRGISSFAVQILASQGLLLTRDVVTHLDIRR